MSPGPHFLIPVPSSNHSAAGPRPARHSPPEAWRLTASGHPGLHPDLGPTHSASTTEATRLSPIRPHPPGPLPPARFNHPPPWPTRVIYPPCSPAPVCSAHSSSVVLLGYQADPDITAPPASTSCHTRTPRTVPRRPHPPTVLPTGLLASPHGEPAHLCSLCPVSSPISSRIPF